MGLSHLNRDGLTGMVLRKFALDRIPGREEGGGGGGGEVHEVILSIQSDHNHL